MNYVLKACLIAIIFSFGNTQIKAQSSSDSLANYSYSTGESSQQATLKEYELDTFSIMETIVININEKTGAQKLKFGEVYEFSFNISNIFSSAILIMGFSRPCLCIVPSWQQTPIAPGAVGFVNVKFTATVIGPSQKTMRAYLYDAISHKAVAKIDITLISNTDNINNAN